MKTMHFIGLCFLVAAMACNNQKKSNRTGTDGTPSPSGTGEYNGREVKIKTGKDTMPIKKAEFGVHNMEVQQLSDDTKIGKPGDWLITFSGSGFMLTNQEPKLVMEKEDIGTSYVNEEGTELYFVIPEQKRNLVLQQFQAGKLKLVNPDKKEARPPNKPEEIMAKTNNLEKVALVYTKFGVTRKRG